MKDKTRSNINQPSDNRIWDHEVGMQFPAMPSLPPGDCHMLKPDSYLLP